MPNIKIFKYNNYFNRIVKKESTLSGYGTAVYTLTGMNFIPGNNVETTQILGKGTNGTFYSDNGNYFVVYNDNNVILSRWFIIDSTRTRNGQYELRLRRDVLADFKDDVLSSKAFIHKGYVDYKNGLLFNSEGTVVNQIKKSEKLLKDKTECPWLYIYIKKGAPSKNVGVDISNLPQADITINTPIANSIYAERTGSANCMIDYAYVYFNRLNYDIIAADWRDGYYAIGADGSSSGAWEQTFEPTLRLGNLGTAWSTFKDVFDAAYVSHWSTINTACRTTVTSSGSWISDIDYTSIINANNKLIKDSNGKYWRLSYSITPVTDQYTRFATTAGAWTTMNSYFANVNINKNSTVPDGTSYGCRYRYSQISVRLEEQTEVGFTITVNPSGKQQCNDAPYNIIAIPYGGEVQRVWYDTKIDEIASLRFDINKEDSIAIANAICNAYGSGDSGYVLDLQLLPYAPFGIQLRNNSSIQYIRDSVNGHVDNATYPGFFEFGFDSQDSDKVVSILYFVSTVQNSFNINYNITWPIYNKYFPLPAGSGIDQQVCYSNNMKLANETEMVRLVSPNYNGQFEFSIAKARAIYQWNVDMTLKPFSPYIHLYPLFTDSVYGSDFNDARGLICGGDFSLPIVNEAWVQYENQNKNYQNIFNRQIENLDFNNRQERIQAKWGIGAGTVQGAAGGALAGAYAGNPYAMAAGAAVGAGTSLAGGLVDLSLMSERQEENRNLQIDMYNYQLGNIKALPYNLTKISAYNYNNKIYPFVEYYSCTDGEKDAIAEKILMNGYTVDAIGLITNYIKPTGNVGGVRFYQETFVQGELIRVDNPDIDNQMVDEINNELQKGVYF